jgi:hypothetical protein
MPITFDNHWLTIAAAAAVAAAATADDDDVWCLLHHHAAQPETQGGLRGGLIFQPARAHALATGGGG